MKNRVRFLTGLVFVSSCALAVLSGLAFVNNIVALVRWWRTFLAAGGDTTNVPAHAPGCFAWLDWSAVDYSAVTTFIPMLGFLCLTVAAFRLFRGRRIRSGDFPFFRGSDQLNVALGLFGTLWGIIVIGYFKLDTVTMADLMQCLHTALFSTLMAVVWVFLIDRPLLRPLFFRLLERSGLAETDDGDLVAAVDRLVTRLGAASDAFDARQRQYEAAAEKWQADEERRQAEAESAAARRQEKADASFLKHLSEMSEDFARRQAAAIEKVAEAQTKANATIAERQASAEAASAKRQAETDAAFTRRFADADAALAKRLADAEAAFAKRQTEADAAFAKRETAEGEAVARALGDLERVRKETSEQCARQLAEYQQAFEARQKEYVEFFQREIAALEKRAKDSESRLKAVVQALQS